MAQFTLLQTLGSLHLERLVGPVLWSGFLLWNIVRSLRNGRAHYMNMGTRAYYVDRKENPFGFWLALALWCAVLTMSDYYFYVMLTGQQIGLLTDVFGSP